MNGVYYYDRNLSFTSLYILIPAIFAERSIKIIMIIQTGVSVLHWNNYNNKIYHNLDNILSSYVFIYHLIFPNKELYYKNLSLFFALLSLITFYYRKGYRELALKQYKKIYIIPHSLFRFFSFWFVMSVYQKDFSILFSLIYWLNIYYLS